MRSAAGMSLFFFSSRRRHTRCSRDWSSDVCSSDLVGENGLALVMKIGTNLSLAVQMLAFCEGVLLAEKSGIAREIAVDVLMHSVIASPMGQDRGPFILKMPEEAGFNVNMMEKDMKLAVG